MKKISFIVLFFIATAALASCAVPYEFSQNMSDLDLIQIEIVNIETATGYHAGAAYNEENISVIKVIEDNKKEDFLSEFKKIKSYQPNIGGRIDYIIGDAIRITYPNGEIDLITSHGTATVTDGKIHNQTTTFDDDFGALLERYS